MSRKSRNPSNKQRRSPRPQSRPVPAGQAALQAKFDQGFALNQQGKLAAAEAIYEQVIAQQPSHFDALHLLGVIALQTRRTRRGVALIQKAIGINPKSADAHSNVGNGLSELGRHADAIESYDVAIALKPDFVDAHSNRGTALAKLKRYGEAIASFDKAIALKPDYAQAHNNRGTALHDSERYTDSIVSYDKAIALKPDYAEAYYNRGTALRRLKRYEEAIASCKKAIALKPDYAQAHDLHERTARWICDWSNFTEANRALTARIDNDGAPVNPFTLLSISDDPARQARCARAFTKHKLKRLTVSALGQSPRASERIHIAYVSADFHAHATAFLMARLFELHDRDRFEISAFSTGIDDGSPMRARLGRAFDHFIDVSDKSDREVAAMIAARQVHIAVDLKGHTRDARTEIFAWRPAPIQVNYLGFPATMGADFIDYIVVDPFLVPPDQQAFFTEKLVHLPTSYQVNDTRREIAEDTPARAEAGLPGQGFVFCSFNNNYKITPALYDIWMRLLDAVPGSVLWLLSDSAAAEKNLRAEARIRDVDPDRVIFAPRCQLADHLARHRLADLFLDTLPYNAHTTASDALWAGLPVVTCAGRSFAARVAGSLLHAVGLPELVTETLKDYEALALRLAREPDTCAAIRSKLRANRDTAPLFDTDHFRRSIEAAYTAMYTRWQAGDAPSAFAVEA